MKEWTSEIVTICWEEGVPSAVLYENGHREIYKLKRATKEDVANLLEVGESRKYEPSDTNRGSVQPQGGGRAGA
jgi:hypothetical protein